MDVTQDVILDLLPAYFSGEASASTRALVDDFLARHPALAERVRREWTGPLDAGGAASHAGPDVELRSLRRTRRALTMQRWFFGLAMAFTVLPLSMEMSFSGGRIREFHFLIRDYPWALWPIVGAGVVCWLLYARLRRQLRIDLH